MTVIIESTFEADAWFLVTAVNERSAVELSDFSECLLRKKEPIFATLMSDHYKIYYYNCTKCVRFRFYATDAGVSDHLSAPLLVLLEASNSAHTGPFLWPSAAALPLWSSLSSTWACPSPSLWWCVTFLSPDLALVQQ